MEIKNLECAMEEMFDFIGDIQSRVIDFDFQCDYDEAFAELEKVKSENVVEVVRCKDCCYRLDCHMNNFQYCAWHKIFVDANAFCSYGKNNLEDKQ